MLDWSHREPSLPAARAAGRAGAHRSGAAIRSCRPRSSRSAASPRGHPEGLREAFANIYAEVAQERMARALGEPVPALPYPRIEEGAHTMAFIEACLARRRAAAGKRSPGCRLSAQWCLASVRGTRRGCRRARASRPAWARVADFAQPSRMARHDQVADGARPASAPMPIASPCMKPKKVSTAPASANAAALRNAPSMMNTAIAPRTGRPGSRRRPGPRARGRARRPARACRCRPPRRWCRPRPARCRSAACPTPRGAASAPG